jgi:DNA helicase-2/ATP-dependent DNA helicase PcrA
MIDKFSPRPAQQQILEYRKGTMGVSAVPGSGKTWTLSLLAANLIKEGLVTFRQEVLVVTLVNSAVNNFTQRISSFLSSYGLIPSLGYRVRTLHGLANDILKERPDLAGLDANYSIIDEREAERIREDACYAWLQLHSKELDVYLRNDLRPRKKDALLKKDIPDLVIQTALQFIRTAKNHQKSPEEIRELLEQSDSALPLAKMCLEIYRIYQRDLSYRGAVDFDDLINLAYQVLKLDTTLLSRLQEKWPFILEDEAQDSSLIQQQILSLLAVSPLRSNWVRVGDPNQAIYESFTTADPRLLIDFINKADFNYILPNSGRSTKNIINLANYLVDWTNQCHPITEARDALYPNKILPTPSDDHQPNPQTEPNQIHLHQRNLTPDEEIQLVAGSVSKWVQEHPDHTVAVLAPRNERGKKLAAALRSEYTLEPIELLNTTLATRKTTGSLVIILSYLLDPLSTKKLGAVYRVWKRDLQSEPERWPSVEAAGELISGIKSPEVFLSPGPSDDWQAAIPDGGEGYTSYLTDFKQVLCRWHEAVLLPVDQLILSLAADIFHTPEELSLAYKIAVFQKQLSDQHPDWELPTLVEELKALARNERRFFGSGEEPQFDPELHRGQVVVTTAHKAKGLEWDRVYLMSANNYNFPSGLSGDSYIPEKWFIRDELNLPAEAASQLYSLLPASSEKYQEGNGSHNARLEYIRERLRLFYVAITRAKKELIITSNSGRSGKSVPAASFQALIDYQQRFLANS